MKRKILLYILICSYLFGLLDWSVIHSTRWANRDWLDWMHKHERTYAVLTTGAEAILCTPCLALKPLFVEAIKRSRASQEEQDAITHAPLPNWSGFYHLVRREESWTFVPWSAWFLNWLVPSILWLWVMLKSNLFIHYNYRDVLGEDHVRRNRSRR